MKKESKPKVKITIKGSTSNVNAGTSIKQGSMVGSPKFVKSKPASKSYSPAPMSAKAKAKAKAAGKESTKENIRKGNNRLGIDRTLIGSVKPAKKASTSYSPKPFDKRAAAVKRGEASRKELASKVAKTAGKVAGKVAGRAKTTAREARDVVTAAGTLGARAFTSANKKDPGNPIKNLARQVKETGKAAVTGKKGTTSDRFGRAIPGRTGWVDMSYGYEKGKKRK